LVTYYDVGTGKTYATIMLAYANVPADLVATGTGDHIIRVYEGGTPTPEGGSLYVEDFSMFTTVADPSNRLIIQGMVSHEGQRGKGIILKSLTQPFIIAINENTHLLDLAFTGDRDFQDTGISCFNYFEEEIDSLIDRCLIYDIIAQEGFTAYGISMESATVRNTAVFNIVGELAYGIFQESTPDNTFTAKIYNCSVHNVRGLATGGDNRFGFGVFMFPQNQEKTIECINTVASGCYGEYNDENFYSPIEATGNINVDYCVSEDDTSDDWGVLHNLINQDPDSDIKYVNTGEGTEDLHIQSGSVNIDSGTPTSITGTGDDWEKTTRPQGTKWDRGVQEFPFEGGCCNNCCCCVKRRWFNHGGTR